MNNKSSFFVLLGYLYIILPILIFIIGYCNIVTTIAGTVIIVICSYFLYKNCPKLWFPENKKEWGLLISIALISLIWVYSSGIGALVFQNLDHNCRNPIFELLVSSDWPVVSSDGSLILTYYIGFWLPPAVIGKIFNSIQIGYYAQILWAALGVFITMYYILSILKKKSIIPFIIFIFFSGLDILGCLVLHKYKLLPITYHIEWWYYGFQFSSITTQLYWVFNQALPAWVIITAILNENNNKNIIFLYSCMFLCATLPAIGFFPVIAILLLKNSENNIKTIFTKNNLISTIKSAFSFPNVIGGCFVFVVCYSYLSNNISGGNIFIKFPGDLLSFINWFTKFFVLEAGLYLLCIYDIQKRNWLFYICTFMLLLYPFIYVGYSADFCMRSTIPAVIILYILIVQSLYSSEFQKKKYLKLLLIIALIIGSVTPIHEITRTIIYTNMGITKIAPDLKGPNFFGYTKGNKFLKYFGKQK